MRHQLIGVAIFTGILGGLLIDTAQRTMGAPIVYAAEPEAPKTILIGTKIEWTEERIIQEIKNTFPDAPIMVEVAKCESRFKQYAYNPTNNSHDGGIFQISKKYHGEEMNELGVDQYDIQENIQFARKLYEREGLKPWNASKKCWSKV